jgi:hypothetical protein
MPHGCHMPPMRACTRNCTRAYTREFTRADRHSNNPAPPFLLDYHVVYLYSLSEIVGGKFYQTPSGLGAIILVHLQVLVCKISAIGTQEIYIFKLFVRIHPHRIQKLELLSSIWGNRLTPSHVCHFDSAQEAMHVV